MATKRRRRRSPEDLEPWERQPKESDPAWHAFCVYRDLGEQRSIRKVHERLAKSETLLKRWSSRHRWRERVVAFTRWEDSVKAAAKVTALEEQGRMEVETGKLLMRLGRGHMSRFLPRTVQNDEGKDEIVFDEKLPAFEARMFAVDGAKLVRLGLGEPEGKVGLDIGGQTFADLARLAREKPVDQDE